MAKVACPNCQAVGTVEDHETGDIDVCTFCEGDRYVVYEDYVDEDLSDLAWSEF